MSTDREGRRAWSLRTWLVVSHLAVLFLPVAVVLGTRALAWDLSMQTKGELLGQAALIDLHVQDELREVRAVRPDATVEDVIWGPYLVAARGETLVGMRLLDPWGVVVGTSGDELGADLSDRPEVVTALAGLPASVFRPRPPQSDRQPLGGPSRRARVRVFVTRPVIMDGQLEGVILLSRTPREELQALYHMSPRLAGGAVVALLLTVGLAVAAGYRFSRSLRLLATVSHRIADGDLRAVEALEGMQLSRLAEVREVQGAWRTMALRLQARLAYISEFAGNVSHEFKTPLSTLKGTVELLRDDPDMPAEQRERFLVNGAAELDRLERLVSGLLALARAEEGVGRERVDLDEVAAQVASRFAGTVFRSGAAAVSGDPRQLDAAIGNLVENAWVHGGDVVAVAVEGWSSEAETGVRVVDDGPGISEGNRARVFARFFTTDREGGGTGLGLSMVEAIARAHGGRVDLESRPGRTVFTLALPRERR